MSPTVIYTTITFHLDCCKGLLNLFSLTSFISKHCLYFTLAFLSSLDTASTFLLSLQTCYSFDWQIPIHSSVLSLENREGTLEKVTFKLSCMSLSPFPYNLAQFSHGTIHKGNSLEYTVVPFSLAKL